MGNRTIAFAAWVAACSIFAARAALAELPPSAYVAQQKMAPEFLVLEIVNVNAQGSAPNAIVVDVRAKVKKVHRTESGVAEGAEILVRYFIPPTPSAGHVGPSSPPILQAGTFVPAYLKNEGRSYGLASGGKSFTTVTWPP